MKKKISNIHAIKIGLSVLKKRWTRTVITVFLLVFCCTAFGICSTTFVNNYEEKQVQLFKNNQYDKNIVFAKKYWTDIDSDQHGDMDLFNKWSYLNALDWTTMTIGDVEDLEEETELQFAYIYGSHSGLCLKTAFFDYNEEYAFKYYFADYDRYERFSVYNQNILDQYELYGETDLTQANTYDSAYREAHISDGVNHLIQTDGERTNQYPAYVPYGQEENYGLKMLAGELPQRVDEIAIDVCMLNEFINRGYYLYEDLENGEVVTLDYNTRGKSTYNSELPVGYILNLDEVPKRDESKIVQINCAEDMIGLKIAVNDHPMERGFSHSSFFLATITGVVDTGCNYETYKMADSDPKVESGENSLRDKVFFSKEWVETYASTGISTVLALKPTDDATIKKCIAVHQRLLDAATALYNGEAIEKTEGIMILSVGETLTNFSDNITTDFPLYQKLFSWIGAFFAVFGILLSYQLISASLKEKRKTVGIIKSLGATNREIYKIFLLESVLVGLAVFVLSMIMTPTLAFGYFGFMGSYGISYLSFGLLQIGLLLVLCFGIPVLSAMLPIYSFLRTSCVEMIGNRERKQ